MKAYFCAKTGLRIVAPGVCKAVDPKNGVDEYSEPAAKAEKPADKAPAKTDQPAAKKADEKNPE